MLVNPNVQPPAYTAQPAPVPNGVGQAEVVRSDLPPVEQAPRSFANQNQLFRQESRSGSRPENGGELATSAREVPGSGTSSAAGSSANSAPGNGSGSAANAGNSNDERVVEQQREQDAAIIRQLKARDREVRMHEAAHVAVGGRYAGSATFQYQRGPDGVNYAVGGEVSISTSKAATPEETLEKARQIRAAALAPAEPSPQDRSVAAEASRMEAEARSEIQAQQAAEREQRRERIEEERSEDREDDRVEAEDQSAAVDDQSSAETVSIADTSVASPDANDDDADRTGNESGEGQAEQPDAREQLEEILLGNQSVPQALNQAGLVDAQNPYGQSGFIEYIV